MNVVVVGFLVAKPFAMSARLQLFLLVMLVNSQLFWSPPSLPELHVEQLHRVGSHNWAGDDGSHHIQNMKHPIRKPGTVLDLI